jgi:hypothetical protein
MAVVAKDVDVELDPAETITLSDNTSLFDIDASTGVIAFRPTQDQVGTYQIQITATDRAGASDRKNFTFEIQDAEDPPVLRAIPDQSAVQDQPFTYTVTGLDQDIPYGDSITFSDDSPLFSINSTTGLISFTPTVKDIGVRRLTVTVTDSHGASDSRSFNLTVLNTIGNTDRPPAIEAIRDQNATEGQLFEYAVKASDPDLSSGDVLSFSDDSHLFDIDNATGRISFRPGIQDPGVSWVNITVRDRDGLSATASFRLTIFRINHAPGLVSVSPTDGTNVTLGKAVVLAAVAGDYDSDTLNYTWREGDNVLGYGANVTVSFDEARTYFITLTVSDGQLEVSRDLSVVVNEPAKRPGGMLGRSPGFESVLAACALAAAALAVALRRRNL